MQKLTVSIIQANLVWEDVDTNLKAFTKKIQSIESTDLIVLPETFSTSFSMNSETLAEPMNGKTMSWMAEIAQNKNAVVAGSAILKENNQIFNRFIWMHPNGSFEKYDKRHLFRMGNEHNHFTAGKERLIVELKGWKICPQICYDLRFPVWARYTQNYDLLIYVANWPKPRINAWDALLKARAIENMSYCIGVNRVGLDNNSHEYPGHSACYDVLGEKLSQIKPNIETTEIITLTKSEIKRYRDKLNFLNDRDNFSLLE